MCASTRSFINPLGLAALPMASRPRALPCLATAALRHARRWRRRLTPSDLQHPTPAGFGVVIASLEAFAIVRAQVVGLGGDNPLISLAVSVNRLAGTTGSASGGMSMALAQGARKRPR